MPQSAAAPTNLLMVSLNDNNTGMHPIVGVVSRQAYGYRAHGERFYILPEDNVPAMRVLPVDSPPVESATDVAEDESALFPVNAPTPRKRKVH